MLGFMQSLLWCVLNFISVLYLSNQSHSRNCHHIFLVFKSMSSVCQGHFKMCFILANILKGLLKYRHNIAFSLTCFYLLFFLLHFGWFKKKIRFCPRDKHNQLLKIKMAFFKNLHFLAAILHPDSKGEKELGKLKALTHVQVTSHV